MEEVETCYQGKFWDHRTKTFKTWKEIQGDINE